MSGHCIRRCIAGVVPRARPHRIFAPDFWPAICTTWPPPQNRAPPRIFIWRRATPYLFPALIVFPVVLPALAPNPRTCFVTRFFVRFRSSRSPNPHRRRQTLVVLVSFFLVVTCASCSSVVLRPVVVSLIAFHCFGRLRCSWPLGCPRWFRFLVVPSLTRLGASRCRILSCRSSCSVASVVCYGRSISGALQFPSLSGAAPLLRSVLRPTLSHFVSS